MKTEKQKMLSGEHYHAGDDELARERSHAQKLMRAYNKTIVDDAEIRRPILDNLLGRAGHSIAIRPPFYVDYGYNIFIGDDVFMNYGCVILDVCRIDIGAKPRSDPACKSIQQTTREPPLSEQRVSSSGVQFQLAAMSGSEVMRSFCPALTLAMTPSLVLEAL